MANGEETAIQKRKRLKSGYPLFILCLTICLLPFAFCLSFLQAKTLILEGQLDSRIGITQQINFSIDRPVSSLEFKFAVPASFSNKAVNQDIQKMNISFSPEPTAVRDETDAYGNHFKRVLWNDLYSDARVTLTFQADLRSELSAMESKIAFPVNLIPVQEAIYLAPTYMVQSSSTEIRSLARRLTAGATTEYAAVTAIMNYIADNVKYAYNPPQFDALYTLETGSGNCQNFAHLSMALLRAAGIPARIVGGISLKQPWKIPVEGHSFLVQSMGQGGHAWMEIYFPDLGWLSYDSQQSEQFTSTRHIKQTHGLDSNDINDSWVAVPYLPKYSETVDSRFLDDNIALHSRKSEKAPRSYILSNYFIAKAGPGEQEITPMEEKPAPPAKAPLPKIRKGKVIEFGNMEFPTFVNLYRVTGSRGVKILDQETAEYVTSQYVFAQAFEVLFPLKARSISLAMRRFGGDGTVYVDLVKDDQGRPAPPATDTGLRSKPVFLESIGKKAGYYWVDFLLPADEAVLKKGKYWIVLRHSGDAIMNWFYTPGKHYGDSDDTRSTMKGYQWEDIQNYDFVFKVKGVVQ